MDAHTRVHPTPPSVHEPLPCMSYAAHRYPPCTTGLHGQQCPPYIDCFTFVQRKHAQSSQWVSDLPTPMRAGDSTAHHRPVRAGQLAHCWHALCPTQYQRAVIRLTSPPSEVQQLTLRCGSRYTRHSQPLLPLLPPLLLRLLCIIRGEHPVLIDGVMSS